MYRKLLYLLLSCTLIGLTLFVQLRPAIDYAQKKKRIRQIVTIGMDIDDAAAALRARGFDVSEKSFATVAKDTYWINVRVASDRKTATIVLLDLLGIHVYYHWVVVEAGIDGKVRRVF